MRAAPRRDTTPLPIPALAVSDGLALIVFVLVGIEQHREASLRVVFLRNAAPLLIAWFAFALLLRLYRRPGLAPLVRTWLVAVPVGVTVRSLIVGSPDDPGRFLTFLAVSMSFTLVFLLIGRGAVWFVAGWRRERPSS
ncbi:MAG TPA: DUF3054 domain-containing protein [Actinomycetota bacterium]|jgi:hypothetical protein